MTREVRGGTGWRAAQVSRAGRLCGTAFLALLLCLASALASAQGVQPVPDLRAGVMDQTGTLDAGSLAALEAKLAAFEQERGSQVVVLMVATTAPEDIADYTQRLGDAWKIGRKEVGDGVLFVIAKDDRRLRIATAKALEGAIPDLLARRILDQAVTPAFRQGDYAGGIEAGVDQILARIRGEELPLPGDQPHSTAGDLEWVDLLIFLAFAVPMIAAVLRSILATSWAPCSPAWAREGWRLRSPPCCGSRSVPGCWACSRRCSCNTCRCSRAPVAVDAAGVIGAAAVVLAAVGAASAVAAASARAGVAISGAVVPRVDGEEARSMLNLSRWFRHLWLDLGDTRRAVPDELAKRLARRVAASEGRHTGEVRLCVEASLPPGELWGVGSERPLAQVVRERALGWFGRLGVWDTEHNNGVLIYLLLAEHAIEFVADRALTERVPQDQWQAHREPAGRPAAGGRI